MSDLLALQELKLLLLLLQLEPHYLSEPCWPWWSRVSAHGSTALRESAMNLKRM